MDPGFEIVGLGSTLIVTSSNVGVQTPLEIVQRKTFAPTDKPVTVELDVAGEVIVPVPEISVQLPVPTMGTFPASVAEDEQMV